MSTASIAGSPDVTPTQRDKDIRPNRRIWLIIGGAGAVVLLLLVASFLLGYFISPNSADKKGNGEPEVLTCEWMKECKRKRKGTPPLLVISSDGFAQSYLNERETPTVLKMGECGGRATVIPSFPTKTFPNHYSMATGLRPGKHGIIENKFKTVDGVDFDQTKGSFYEGEPIWNTAVKHGKKSKVFIWMGSYDAINGVEATFHLKKWELLPLLDKINNVTDWLTSDDPPDLAMLYLEQPDPPGHDHGPNRFQLHDALFSVDSLIKYTLKRLHDAGVLGCINIVLVSDHGMRDVKKNDFINLEDIDSSFDEKQLQAHTHVIFNKPVSTTALQANKGKHYRIYRSKDEIPLRYHYDHDNIPFPYLCGNPGVMFFANKKDLEYFDKVIQDKGNHGWDNLDEKMQAIFFTIGPSIKQNVTLPAFQNIEMYNFFADLMSIPPAPNDGTAGLLDDVLLNAPSRVFSLIQTKPCSGNAQVSGFNLASRDNKICYKTDTNFFILYSQVDNLPIAFEISTSSVELSQLAIDYASQNFGASSLVEKAIRKLAVNKGTKMQIGQFMRNSKLFFVSGFWCDGEDNLMDKQCKSEKDMRTEAYVIPESAEENFNDLPLDDLLFDYRVSIDDIERATQLNLLPQSMDLAVRRRVALLIPNSKWI